jgi:hypothetical protein
MHIFVLCRVRQAAALKSNRDEIKALLVETFSLVSLSMLGLGYLTAMVQEGDKIDEKISVIPYHAIR